MRNFQRIRSFRDNIQGNVAIMFGLTSVAILTGVGVGVSAMQLHNQKLQLNAAADAAVLAGVIAASEDLAVDDTGATFVAAGTKVAEDSFALHIADIKGLPAVTPEIEFKRGGRNLVGQLTYRTTGKTFLSEFVGRDEVPISTTVEAVKSTFKFARINFVIDNSMSMGIGADLANQQKLEAVNDGCAVACHYRLNTSASVTLPAARAADVRLRIDTVKDAVAQMINRLDARKETSNQFQVAIYTFSNTLEEHLAPTLNYASALAAVDAIELVGSDGEGGTNLRQSLDDLAVLLPTTGDGATVRTRESLIVAMIDGVEDSALLEALPDGTHNAVVDPNSVTYQPSRSFPPANIQGVDPTSCDVLKSQGHIIGFVNPTYLVPDISVVSNPRHRNQLEYIRDTLVDKIVANTQTCASRPELSFSAETEVEVEQAAADLFDQLLSEAVRLSE